MLIASFSVLTDETPRLETVFSADVDNLDFWIIDANDAQSMEIPLSPGNPLMPAHKESQHPILIRGGVYDAAPNTPKTYHTDRNNRKFKNITT